MSIRTRPLPPTGAPARGQPTPSKAAANRVSVPSDQSTLNPLPVNHPSRALHREIHTSSNPAAPQSNPKPQPGPRAEATTESQLTDARSRDVGHLFRLRHPLGSRLHTSGGVCTHVTLAAFTLDALQQDLEKSAAAIN